MGAFFFRTQLPPAAFPEFYHPISPFEVTAHFTKRNDAGFVFFFQFSLYVS